MLYFRYELRRGLVSSNFKLALFINLLCLLIGCISSWDSIETIKGASFFLYSFSLGGSSLLPILAPMIASLPFSNSYLEDKENNMTYALLTRMTYRRYFFTKTLSVTLLGILALVLPLLFLLIINVLFFPPWLPIYMGVFGGAWSGYISSNPFIYLILLLLNSCVFAMVYALLGWVVTFFIDNKFISILFPFTVYFLPSFIFPILGLDSWEPVATFDLTANSATTELIVYGQFLFLGLSAILIAYPKLKKELIYDSKRTH